ncbi:hypothetical protein AYO44_10810 [Planctomycetaceae bacterium SCGC AG-212-F19]|nr:hypothetical protein AYO44_10810 [Planctomycetaceae bacterium SCGC AG-212-F19]
MAKVKTKQCCFDTTCTESRAGTWTWETQTLKWQCKTSQGLNLFLLTRKEPQFMASFKTLDMAVAYSWGYTYGFNEGKQAK